MDKKKAKLKFKHNSFEIIEQGDFVLCAISGKKIPLQEIRYWNVDIGGMDFVLLNRCSWLNREIELHVVI